MVIKGNTNTVFNLNLAYFHLFFSSTPTLFSPCISLSHDSNADLRPYV